MCYKTRIAHRPPRALQQASKLEAEAVKGLGLPRIDLNVRAYAFHNELDVPLGALKNNLEHTLSAKH